MYLEPNQRREYSYEKENMSSDDVKEATAALKGMLGIGNAGKGPSPVKQSAEAHPVAEKKVANISAKKKRKQKQRQPPPPSSQPQGQKRDDAKKAPTENFAWSAFQSSPDASTLPMPAFVSSFSPEREREPSPGKPALSLSSETSNTDALSALLTAVRGVPSGAESSAPPAEIANAPRAEEFEAQVIAAAEKAAAEAASVPKEDSKSDKHTKHESQSEPPVSKTGINLAALAASPPAKLHFSADANAVPRQQAQHFTSNTFSSPSNIPTFASPRSHPHHLPYSSPHQSFPPHSPPGFVTIQVQVPPVLMPGRQMLVASPAGYPVQVAIPDGVQPGMVIPVHVPMHPMMMGQPHSPYHFPHGGMPQSSNAAGMSYGPSQSPRTQPRSSKNDEG